MISLVLGPKIDRHPFLSMGSRTIAGVSVWHAMQAGAMLLWPSAAKATCAISVVRSLKLLDVPDGHIFAAFAMIAVAAAAMSGVVFQHGRIRLLLFIPQQFVVGLMAGGGAWAMWMGRYLDGTPIPSPHIFVDQGVWVLLFLLHWDAITRRARIPNA